MCLPAQINYTSKQQQLYKVCVYNLMGTKDPHILTIFTLWGHLDAPYNKECLIQKEKEKKGLFHY